MLMSQTQAPDSELISEDRAGIGDGWSLTFPNTTVSPVKDREPRAAHLRVYLQQSRSPQAHHTSFLRGI